MDGGLIATVISSGLILIVPPSPSRRRAAAGMSSAPAAEVGRRLKGRIAASVRSDASAQRRGSEKVRRRFGEGSEKVRRGSEKGQMDVQKRLGSLVRCRRRRVHHEAGRLEDDRLNGHVRDAWWAYAIAKPGG